jgi:hypothetical protein
VHARPRRSHPDSPSPETRGARNRSGAVGKTYSSGHWPRRTTGWVPASVTGGEATKRASQTQEAAATNLEKRACMERQAERGPRPGTPHRGPCALDQRSVSRSAPREGRVSLRPLPPQKKAGCALGGGSWEAQCAPAAAWRQDPVSAAPPPHRLLSGCWSRLRPAAERRAISGAGRRGGEDREGRGGGAYAKRLTPGEGGAH